MGSGQYPSLKSTQTGECGAGPVERQFGKVGVSLPCQQGENISTMKQYGKGGNRNSGRIKGRGHLLQWKLSLRKSRKKAEDVVVETFYQRFT